MRDSIYYFSVEEIHSNWQSLVLWLQRINYKVQNAYLLNTWPRPVGLPSWCPDPALLHRRGHVQPCSAPAPPHSPGLPQLCSAPPILSCLLQSPLQLCSPGRALPHSIPAPPPYLQLCCPDLALHISCNCLWFVRCFCSNLQVVVGLRAYSRLERQSKRSMFMAWGFRAQYRRTMFAVPSKYIITI